jgi:hypothetical protein
LSTQWPPYDEVAEIVRAIHAAPGRVCLVTTGVGAQAIYWLFAEAGASRTILDAQVPYVGAALDEYVGVQAKQHVSAEEAAKMAAAALTRARQLMDHSGSEPATPLFGVACTGAIATDRVRRGENRLHVAWTDGQRTRTFSLVFQKGARDRAGEEAAGSALLLNAVAEAKGVPGRLSPPLVNGESIVESD